jgi:hypothetical protein
MFSGLKSILTRKNRPAANGNSSSSYANAHVGISSSAAPAPKTKVSKEDDPIGYHIQKLEEKVGRMNDFQKAKFDSFKQWYKLYLERWNAIEALVVGLISKKANYTIGKNTSIVTNTNDAGFRESYSQLLSVSDAMIKPFTEVSRISPGLTEIPEGHALFNLLMAQKTENKLAHTKFLKFLNTIRDKKRADEAKRASDEFLVQFRAKMAALRSGGSRATRRRATRRRATRRSNRG